MMHGGIDFLSCSFRFFCIDLACAVEANSTTTTYMHDTNPQVHAAASLNSHQV